LTSKWRTPWCLLNRRTNYCQAFGLSITVQIRMNVRVTSNNRASVSLLCLYFWSINTTPSVFNWRVFVLDRRKRNWAWRSYFEVILRIYVKEQCFPCCIKSKAKDSNQSFWHSPRSKRCLKTFEINWTNLDREESLKVSNLVKIPIPSCKF